MDLTKNPITTKRSKTIQTKVHNSRFHGLPRLGYSRCKKTGTTNKAKGEINHKKNQSHQGLLTASSSVHAAPHLPIKIPRKT
jgi:hypothetical protein